MFIKTLFALVHQSRPMEGECIAHGLHYLAGKDCACACYVVESMRNALTLRALRWVNQAKMFFNKHHLECYSRLPFQLSACSEKIPEP